MGLLRRGSVSVEIGRLEVQLEGNHAAYPTYLDDGRHQ